MAERLNSSNLGQFALGSSGVQASDPVGKQLGASDRALTQISESSVADVDVLRTAAGLLGEEYDERGFLGGLDSVTTASRKAEIQQAIFNINNTKNKNALRVQELSSDLWEESGYLHPVTGRPILLPKSMSGEGQTADYWLHGKPYETPERTQGKRTGWTFKGVAVAPSALYDMPTSTTNWRRPRTVAAGYDYDADKDKGVLTVVFRDGTFYNYYDVPPSVWIEFHDSFSKGPMLNRKTKNGGQAMDGKLLAYKHGPADMSALSQTAQDFLYKAARTVQIYNRDKAPRINQATGKAYTYKGKETVGSGQNTRAKRKRDLNKLAKKGGYNPNRNAGKRRTP